MDILFLARIPAILLALTVHEYAHGYIAWIKGDSTAADQGRLTFNPLIHLDLMGTAMLLFGPFGWAKPVPVNPYNLANPRKDMVAVAAAGPIANIALAIIMGYIFKLIKIAGIENQFLYLFFGLSIQINLGLAIFNLLPVPPLDGYNILLGLLPHKKAAIFSEKMRFAPYIFMGLIIGEWFLKIPIFSLLMKPIWEPWLSFWYMIIL